MPFAKEKGQPAIYYETIGKGTPIIFIPPPGVGHLTFRYQVPLMDQCKLITFDVRGDCQSERSTEPMTMTQLAYDVKRVLDANCVRKAIVVGTRTELRSRRNLPSPIRNEQPVLF